MYICMMYVINVIHTHAIVLPSSRCPFNLQGETQHFAVLLVFLHVSLIIIQVFFAVGRAADSSGDSGGPNLHRTIRHSRQIGNLNPSWFYFMFYVHRNLLLEGSLVILSFSYLLQSPVLFCKQPNKLRFPVTKVTLTNLSFQTYVSRN
jgi:hypothetical protein